ncbi:hypothetical protein MMC30_007528 [Trapelia coarctata]|nr:hypothetical protein [Trapelia coarctata]
MASQVRSRPSEVDVSSDEVGFGDSDGGNGLGGREVVGKLSGEEGRSDAEGGRRGATGGVNGTPEGKKSAKEGKKTTTDGKKTSPEGKKKAAPEGQKQTSEKGATLDSQRQVDVSDKHEDTASDEDTDADQIPPKKPKEPVVKVPVVQVPTRARPSRKSALTKDLKDLKQEDMIPTPQKPRALKRASDEPDLLDAAKRRSLTRSAIEPKKVNYDVKYHPMDKATRPNAPATLKAREEYEEDEGEKDEDEEADDEAEVETPSKRVLRGRGGRKANYDMAAHPLNPLFQTKNSARKSSSKDESVATDESSAPFANPTADTWELLAPLDQHLHHLQGGAPDDTRALPLKWSEVVDTLIEEGWFTRKQFNRWGGFSALRERYEEIRQVAQGDYADQEPRDREDRRVYFQEGWDVFDLDNTQTYRNHNIPKYMRGFKGFTSRDLAMYEKEYIKAQNDAADDTQDTSMQDASMSSASTANPRKAQPVTVTLGDPDDSGTERATTGNLLLNEIRRMEVVNGTTASAEDAAMALDGQLVSAEDAVMVMDEYASDTPTKIVLSGTASATGTSTESPSASQKEPVAKSIVAPFASMVSPLSKKELDEQVAATHKAELAAQSIAATKALINKQPKSTPTSSRNFIDALASPSAATPSQQLLQEVQKTPNGGNTFPSTAKEQLHIGGETIPGTTRKQLPRGRRKSKVKPGSASNFEIHKDTPGNTPKAKSRRNAVTEEVLKENMPEELDEHGQRVTPDIQPSLTAWTATYDAAEARRQAVNASPTSARAEVARSSPDPLTIASPTRPSWSMSGVLLSIEDGHTGAAATVASPPRGVQTRTSGGVSVVIPRAARRRTTAAEMM